MKSVTTLPAIAVLVAAWYFGTVADAATVQLPASRDTTIHSDDPGASNGSGPVFFAGRTNRSGGFLRRALIRFDITSIPAGSVIASVSLDITATRDPGNPPQLGTLRRILTDWGEAGSSNTLGSGAPAQVGDATWSHRFFGPGGQLWTTAGGDLAGASSSTATLGPEGSVVTFASTPQLVADVQGWINGTSANYGWAILGDEATVGSAIQFGSRENSDLLLRPTLSISYSPSAAVPAGPAIAVLGVAVGLLGLGIFGLRRRIA